MSDQTTSPDELSGNGVALGRDEDVTSLDERLAINLSTHYGEAHARLAVTTDFNAEETPVPTDPVIDGPRGVALCGHRRLTLGDTQEDGRHDRSTRDQHPDCRMCIWFRIVISN